MKEARAKGATVTFDVNYRQRLWDAKSAAAAARQVAPLVDVLVCTAEDASDLFGARGAPEAVLKQLQSELGSGTVVVFGIDAIGIVADRECKEEETWVGVSQSRIHDG